MQKLRGYLALGTFIMGIVSVLCLLLPLIEITDDALMLMMLAVPPLICGLFIAVALHMLLYTLLLVLYGCRIQLVALYFLQYIRRKTVGWRVQYLPAAERKMSIVMEAVPWEKETGRQQERARTALFYVQTALAILFYALAVNLIGSGAGDAKCPPRQLRGGHWEWDPLYFAIRRYKMVTTCARVAVAVGFRLLPLPLTSPSETAQSIASDAQDATADASENLAKSPDTAGFPALR